jgi:hypothetical protein
MAVFKSIPSQRIINGIKIETSESAVVTNSEYTTNGEYVIVTKGIDFCVLNLNEQTTDHVVVKSLTNTIVKSNQLIDEEFNEVELSKGSCVEFKYIGNFWYILSSDGLKNS